MEKNRAEHAAAQMNEFTAFCNATKSKFAEATQFTKATTHLMQDAQSQLFDEVQGDADKITVPQIVEKIEALRRKGPVN